MLKEKCTIHTAQYIRHKLLAIGTKVCPLFPHRFNNQVSGRSGAQGPTTFQNQFCYGFVKAVFTISGQTGFPETGPGNPRPRPVPGTHTASDNAQYTMHSIQSTIHTAQYTMHSIQCTVHNAQYTMHNTQCTVHI